MNSKKRFGSGSTAAGVAVAAVAAAVFADGGSDSPICYDVIRVTDFANPDCTVGLRCLDPTFDIVPGDEIRNPWSDVENAYDVVCEVYNVNYDQFGMCQLTSRRVPLQTEQKRTAPIIGEPCVGN